MSANSQTVAILLAAGGGTRFAGTEHKLTALIAGRAVCSWSLQHLLEAEFQNVVVVTGAVDLSTSLNIADLENSETIQIVQNSLWQSGLASSLQCGIKVARDLGAQAVVVGLADQPAIPATAWQQVAASNSPIAVATYNAIRGNPVRLHAELWQLLPETGDDGARMLFKSHRDLIEEIACRGSAQDVDTISDLDTLRKIFGGN
ncbi:MAG: nucleotidyltransferase family protein [Actinobacteria bacterium]|nr:nucleotidyltransferase family protein [Ilumatobacteraceae bacterium]MCX6531155.1 nucleotidyltransferase family protein [Actinomycetota bacterium]